MFLNEFAPGWVRSSILHGPEKFGQEVFASGCKKHHWCTYMRPLVKS